MSDSDIETARLMARLKLQVRRRLDRGVDLRVLVAGGEPAERILAELEELADDEDLLVTLLRLRERLFPPRREAAAPRPAAELAAPTRPARDYRFGARGG